MSTNRLQGTARLMISDHNLVGVSELFSHASWAQNGSPILTAGQADPFGGTKAFLIEDDSAGVTQWVQYTIPAANRRSAAPIAFGVFVREGPSPATEARAELRNGTASTVEGQIRVTGWSAGVPTVTYAQGATKLFERARADGWHFLAALSDTGGIASTDDVVLRIEPAGSGAADVGDVYVFGAMVLDVQTIGGYVPTTPDTPILWDGSTPQTIDLRVPLQQVRPRTAMVKREARTLNQRHRTVATFGHVHGAHARVRYENEPQKLLDVLTAASKGYPLVYVPDDTDMDTAFECELLAPSFIDGIPFDVDQMPLDEHTIDLVLDRMDGGTVEAMF